MTCRSSINIGLLWFFSLPIFQGYVIVDSFFKKEELDACRDAIDVLVDDLARMLYTGNKIKGKPASEV